MSFGNKVGRGIGALGAFAVEGAVRGATGLGSFGSDLVDGVEEGYTEKSAALLMSREARAAKLKAAKDAAIAARSAPIEAAPAKRGKTAAV